MLICSLGYYIILHYICRAATIGPTTWLSFRSSIEEEDNNPSVFFSGWRRELKGDGVGLCPWPPYHHYYYYYYLPVLTSFKPSVVALIFAVVFAIVFSPAEEILEGFLTIKAFNSTGQGTNVRTLPISKYIQPSHTFWDQNEYWIYHESVFSQNSHQSPDFHKALLYLTWGPQCFLWFPVVRDSSESTSCKTLIVVCHSLPPNPNAVQLFCKRP